MGITTSTSNTTTSADMKILLLCALVAVASSQFALNPAEVILQRQGNRAILRVPENFQFGANAIPLIQGPGGAGGSRVQSSSFQASQQQQQQQQQQQRSQFQQQEAAARFQQQQQQQQQQQAAAAAAAAASATAQQRYQQSQGQSLIQSQQQGQRVPVKTSTILAGATQGTLVAGGQSSSGTGFSRTSQQEFSQQQQELQQAQQQRTEFQAQQQLVQQQQQDGYDSEVQGVFEPLNLPSGASLLLGQVSTQFSCNDRPYGYYGDDTNNCQVFHICYPALFSSGVIETYQYSFMCGEGTQFDQKEMACVSHETALPCIETQNYYIKNAEFGLPHEKSG